MRKKTNQDPVTESALSIVESEQMEEQLVLTEQEKKERLIAVSYEMIGRIQAASLMSKFGDISRLIWLKQVKKTKVYKDIPGIETWETFCNYVGKSRRLVDEQIQNLNILGEEFLAICRQFSLSYKDLRKLRKRVTDSEVIIDEKTAIIAGETIPLDPEHKDDLEAAIESLLDEKDNQLENKNATLKAKDRVLEAKEKIINKQEKELHKLTRQVKARGFEPGEENFIQDMENLKIMIVGMELKMDVRNMPADMTPLMRAAYIETLGHFKSTMIAYYYEATNHYGIADDDDWVPPYEREADPSSPACASYADRPSASGCASKLRPDKTPRQADNDEYELIDHGPEEPGTVNCTTCQFHKGMMNKAKGVKIPGCFGKCTRPEGICFSETAVRALKVQGDITEDAE